MAGAGKLGSNQRRYNQNAEASPDVQNEPGMFLEKSAYKLPGPGFRGWERIILPIVVRWTLHVIPVTNAHKPPKENGARCRFRTCDPYRVKVMLYH
jgi:hypothetical protein